MLQRFCVILMFIYMMVLDVFKASYIKNVPQSYFHELNLNPSAPVGLVGADPL